MKEKLKKIIKGRLLLMLSMALIASLLLTAFPIHIGTENLGNAVLRIGSGEGGYYITIGSPVSAADADYTCNGIADDVTFQSALNALPAIGGQLFVLAGTYNFTDATTVTRAIDDVSVIGVGAAVTFEGDGSTAIFTAGGNNWLFSNLETDAGGLNMGATTDWMWLHVTIDTTYYPLRTDDLNIEDLSSRLTVGGADTVFPADPNADKFLMWDDVPGQLSWEDAGGIGDMQKSTYDTDEDGDIDTAAGGTEWDSSAATGVAYITAGAWGTRATGISNTYIVIVDDADAANGDIPYFTTSGLAGYNEAEFKSAYNMEAGTDYQAYDAELAAIAGLTSAADKMIYFTGSGTAATSDLTSFARSILDDANEATFKATVNLEIGTDVQAWDTDLDDIAALSDADNNFIVGNGANWVVESGATVRQSLGLVIGTDVQAHDAELDALAELTSAADKVPYFTGSGTADVADLTSYGRSMIAVADEAAFKLLTNLEIGVDVLAQQTIGIADDNLLEVDDVDASDNDFAKFTANGVEGRSYSEVLGDLSGQAGSTFDWNGQTLSDFGIETGSTLDTTPIDGQFFLHTPTGRNILYQYENSAWNPIQSFGSMTLYVDATDGTDSLTDHGHGVDGDAFATVQFAVDCIPGLFGGDVTINVNSETYSEDVVIQGKSATGDYDIIIQGTLSQQASATADSKTTGSGATQGTLTDTGAFGSYDDLLVEITNDDEYRIIDSDTSDVITIVGTFSDAVDLAYIVWDWGTTIQSIEIASGQTGVVVYDVQVSGDASSNGVIVYQFGRVDLYRCEFDTCALHCYGTINCYTTLWTGDPGLSRTVRLQDNATGTFYRSKVSTSNVNGRCVSAYNGAVANVIDGSIIDGNSSSGIYGIHTEINAMAITYAASADGYVRIRNCATGIRAEEGAQVIYTSNNQYSGNTADESADAGSFGYID